MSKSNYSQGSSSVDDWLESQYEYMVPDKDLNNPYVPRDAAKDITPEHSDASPPRSKESRPSKNHSRAKDRYRPVTPPEEEDLDKERDRHRHKGRSTRSHDGDRDSRRSHQERDPKYPPKADRGRPRRPPMGNRATSHYVPRKEDSPERRPHRRYSLSSSPPRHRGDKSSRHYRRHQDRSPSPPRSSRKKEDREREGRGHHHSSSGSTKGTKSRRPSLARSQTSKDPKKPSLSTRSFSFLDDPRFKTAAQAAMTAGASAAVGLAGQKGGWGGDKGAKVLRAGLGAAALSALKSPAPSPDPAPAPAPAPEPAAAAADPIGPQTKAANATGRFMADHMPKKKSTRRRHH